MRAEIDNRACVSSCKMAEELADGIKQELTCAVCLDQLTKPKVLPCLHTYCQACIEAIVVKSQEKDTVDCPKCRESHPLPENGVPGFTTNFTAQNLLELLEVHEADQKKKSSKILQCENGLDINVAVARCQDCSIYLCDACWKAHQKMVATRKHQIVSLEEVKKKAKLLHRPQFCPKHENEILKLYCKTCSKPICGDCTYVDHRDHKYVFLKDVQKELRKELEKAMEGLTIKEIEFQGHLERVHEVEAEHFADTEARELQINQDFNSFIEQLQARRGEALREFKKSAQIKGKQIRAEAEAVELSLAKLTSSTSFGRRLLESGSDVEVATMASHTIERAKGLHSMKHKKEDFGSSLMREKQLCTLYACCTSIRCPCQSLADAVIVEGTEDISIVKPNKLKVKLAEHHLHPYVEAKIIHTYSSGEAHDVKHTITSTGECSWVVSFTLQPRLGKCSVAITVNKIAAQGSPFTVPVRHVDLPVGTRVRRGPDWKWGNQDSNGPGVVAGPDSSDKWINVKWDSGNSNSYRWGVENTYDLKPIFI